MTLYRIYVNPLAYNSGMRYYWTGRRKSWRSCRPEAHCYTSIANARRAINRLLRGNVIYTRGAFKIEEDGTAAQVVRAACHME